MEFKKIDNEETYKKYLAMIKSLIEKDPETGTKDAKELDVLAKVIGEYEEYKYPINEPSELDKLRFRIDQDPENKVKTLFDFVSVMVENQKTLDPEANELANKQFWDLVAK